MENIQAAHGNDAASSLQSCAGPGIEGETDTIDILKIHSLNWITHCSLVLDRKEG